ncbi:BQ2448_6187 [Microbotryum intermedium]|uniref:BQ2448_6187 protein n=1 Tax=Microbotryum intermedium TaxID=269621 RepID=A0A238FKH1_9BASI|nr:BQ2448_6187 [Microbotryum intermedium]
MLGNCNDPSLAYYYLPNIGSPATTQKDGRASSWNASYVPIYIPSEDQATQALIRVLREPLLLERNLVSLTLLYSLLSPHLPKATASHSKTLAADDVDHGNDQDSNWIRQLSLEYSIDLQKVLEVEQEPDEQQLMQAIGAKGNLHILRKLCVRCLRWAFSGANERTCHLLTTHHSRKSIGNCWKRRGVDEAQ